MMAMESTASWGLIDNTDGQCLLNAFSRNDVHLFDRLYDLLSSLMVGIIPNRDMGSQSTLAVGIDSFDVSESSIIGVVRVLPTIILMFHVVE